MPTTELTLQDPTSFPIISNQQQQQQQQQQQSSIITNFHTNTSNNTNSNGIISNSKPFVNLFNAASKGHAMIRHSSLEANSHPGLSFFCKNDNTFKESTKREKVFEKSLHVQSTTTHAPLVISRLNISHRNNTMATTTATTTTAMNKNGLTDLDDEEDTIDTPPTSPTTNTNKINTKPVNQHHTFFNFTSSFKPGFGSVGTFMLRGSSNNGSNNNNNNSNNNNRHQLDEARVNRKIEDLEIEKKSLLTLNQTLESVVKQQSNTIQDLQSRLAAVEGPLKPGLSNSLNVKGVMSTSSVESADDNEELEDDDAAFERIRNMLLLLIEQAQSAVLEREDEVLGIRVITGGEDQYQQQGMTRKNQRPRSMDGRSTNKIISATTTVTVGNNKILSRRQSLTSIQEQQQQQQSKRRSLQVTTPTSPIPNRRLSLQKSVSRSSSPAVLFSEDSRCPSPTPSVRSTTNKKKLNSNKQQQQQQQQQQTVRKWQN